MMKKQIWHSFKNYAPGFVLGVVCTASLAGGAVFHFTDDPKALITFLLDFQEIKQNYFRPIEDKTLFAGASQGMFASVGDSYTMVLSGDAYESFMQSATGEYGGIGIVMGQGENSRPVILKVFDVVRRMMRGLLLEMCFFPSMAKKRMRSGLQGRHQLSAEKKERR